MTSTSYATGPINGNWSIILTPQTRKLKYSSVNHPQLLFNGTVVAKVNEQKHLGLIFISGLSFEKHLSEIILKPKNNIGLIKHLSKLLPLKTHDQMYKPLIRSYRDYCDDIYHQPS